MSWKCFGNELSENHLGVALIQPGDSVIVANERFCRGSIVAIMHDSNDAVWTIEKKYRIIRVEPRNCTSLTLAVKCERAFFFAFDDGVNENYEIVRTCLCQ